MSKYRVPVYIHSEASKYIGEVECDSIEEFNEKSQELWESQEYEYPTTNITNDFDLGDWDIDKITPDILKYHENQ